MAAELRGTASLLSRPDTVARSYDRGYSLGPVEIGDTSEGAQVYVWRGRLENGEGEHKVFITREEDGEWREEVELFSFEGVPGAELDMAFNQNGGINVCVQRATGEAGGSEVWFYYFSTISGAFVFEAISPGRTPRVLLDTLEAVADSDILLFYLNDTNQRVEYRTQRTLFEEVQLVPVDIWFDLETRDEFLQSTTVNMYLEEVLRTKDHRVQIVASIRNPVTGRYRIIISETSPYGNYPLDSVALSSNVVSLDVIFYIFEVLLEDDIDLLCAITEILVQELILTFSEEGPDGWLAPDMLDLDSVITAIVVSDLIIQLLVLDEVDLQSEITALTVALFILVMENQLPDSLDLLSSITSITVEAL